MKICLAVGNIATNGITTVRTVTHIALIHFFSASLSSFSVIVEWQANFTMTGTRLKTFDDDNLGRVTKRAI